MKLNLSVRPDEHTDIVTALGWSTDGQLMSCSDDKTLVAWGADGESKGKVSNTSAFVTRLDWFPGTGKQAPDIFAVSCADGSFMFVSRSGREEKTVKAHEGAIICIQWSHDGSALVTAGEDGEVKIWSKSGNFRSSIARTGVSVYACCWGPDDDQILYSNGNQLVIKTVQANKKNLQWNAHDGIVMCLDWNIANNLIVSGGEDCTYCVFDAFGRQLYASRPLEQVVTSVAWCPNGEYFAVGSHNLVRLCDKTGWTYSRERIESGSLMQIAWTADGTQFAGAGGNGSVVFAQVVGRHFEWKNYEITLTEPRKLRVEDVANETQEDLEFARDRVVELGVGFDHLVVATTSQCFIYTLTNLNTPIIFEIKAAPHFVKLCKNHFLTLDQMSGIMITNYEGRQLANLRFQGLRPEYITRDMVGLSPDTVVVVDSVDQKVLQIMDTSSGRLVGKHVHSTEITNVSLNQHTLGPQERLLVFSDKNHDLYVCNLGAGTGPQGPALPTYRLRSHVESFLFNDETDVLVGLADGRLLTWYTPGVPFVDKDLLEATTNSSEDAEFGRNAQIAAFTGPRITIRKVDGSVLFVNTPLDIPIIYDYVRQTKWEEAVRLCRHQKNEQLWGCLATMALQRRQLDYAETGLAELNEVAKLEYIQSIKNIPSEEGRNAELALYRRQVDEAERILLQAQPPLVYRAIKMNLLLYRWSRALELALKYSTHVETVIAYRQRHLDEFGKNENNKNFLKHAPDVEVNWDEVVKAEKIEVDNESRRRGGNRK